MEIKASSRAPLIERMIGLLAAKAREYRIPLFASMLTGLLTYGFAFSNKLVNHDEVFCLFSKGATVDSGRWGLGLLDNIFPNYSMPWIYGIITITLIAISICLMVHIFSIQNKLLQVLLAGNVIAFPSLIGTFGYMFTSSSYGVSFLLAVLAVWLLQTECRSNALWALMAMIASLSIYQSYIAIAASLLVLILIQQLLHGEKVFSVLRRGIGFVVFLLLSLGLYYLVTQAVLHITNTQFNLYTANNLEFSITAIPANISLAYTSFLRFFTESYHGLIPTPLSRLAHYICFISAGILLLLWGLPRKNREFPRILLLLVLLGLLPLAVNCMYLITSADSIHTLVLYGFISLYILTAVIADACLSLYSHNQFFLLFRNTAHNLLLIAISVILLINIYTANETYLNLYLRYENAYAFYTSLIADIKMMPEFEEGTKLAILGTYEQPDFYEEHFPSSGQITGVYGFIPDSYSKERFLYYYLGFSVPFASTEEAEFIQASQEYQEMSEYPYYGSIKMIGDTLVVKLSS